MTLQDTASGVALWRQVADGIERGIADGRFAAGEKLPGETEIAETYRVNRHTVRRALATLAERGLVRAERGSGTYVEAPRLAYPLRSRTRFSEIVGAGGREPRGQLIDASEEAASRGGVKVCAIHLRLGPLSGVVKDALLFSYEIACNGTSLEGSRLLIEEMPVTGNCTTCGAETAVVSPQQMCCAVCRTPMLEVVGGRELEVSALEIEG